MTAFMSRRMTVGLLPLSDILGAEQVLLVPSFQRPYSWEEQVGQLLDDILSAMAEDVEWAGDEEGYFLGTMVLTLPDGEPAASDGGEPRRRSIVDGQQRLLTLTILIAVLRDLADDRDLAFAGELEPLLRAGFAADGRRRARLVLGGEDQAFLEEMVLAPGASVLMPEDDDLTDSQERILAAREYILAELHDKPDRELADLARYLASSCAAAVLGTRGLDRAFRYFEVLNNRGLPLESKDILKAQILGLVPAERRDVYADRWQAIESRLQDRLGELFSHIRTIEGRGRERIVEGVGDLVAQAGSAERFFDEWLEPYAGIMMAILEAEGPTPAASRTLGYLDWLGSADWMPPAMLYWHQVGGYPARIEAFLLRLDRLAYSLRLLGIGADKRKTRFRQVLAAVRQHRGDADDGPLELTREECRNINYNLKSLHSRSQLTCKLLLLRVNDEIAGAPQNLDPTRYTVEHVLPQRPGRGSRWRTWFASADERETATQSLGNLVLVTLGQNSKARNAELERKLAVYFDPDGGPVPHITADLKGIEAWTPADVAAREARILASVDRLWQLDTQRGDGLPGEAADRVQPRPRRKVRRFGG